MSQADPTRPADPDDGDTAVGGSSGGGGDVDGSALSASSAEAGGDSATAGKSAEATDSRRVAPKWLGKRIGRFRLQGLLGQGAVGRVFRAEDAVLHRRVALKVIASHSADGQINRDIDQFLTEARAAAGLEHPHVVQIYEAGESGTLCYIAMELLEGGSLKDLIEAAGPMDPARACLLAADAAEALGAGHSVGIIHRDVKPANLMLSRTGRCKVTDFGLATIADADGAMTRDKAAGTPLFAAPEVIRGTSADERSDIYSLGATLYYLLAGRPPYKAKTRKEVLRMHLEEPIPDLRQIRPGLPEALVAAVEKALDKDPGRRFVTAQQFARVLRVLTIPTPAPATVVDPVGAALMTMSGMTAVTGNSSGRMPVAATAGRLAPADLGGPHATAAPQPIDYRTPTSRPRNWHPAAVLAVGGAAGILLVGGLGYLLTDYRQIAAPPMAIVAPPATVVPIVPPPVIPPPTSVAVVPPTPSAELARSVERPAAPPVPASTTDAVDVTDLPRLERIAAGREAGHANRFATVTGTIASTRLIGSGTVMRVEFADSPFIVVYWDTGGKLFDAMTARFGPTAARLDGETVHVHGRIKMYGKYPELVLTRSDDLRVDRK